jgi:hypothetical protein
MNTGECRKVKYLVMAVLPIIVTEQDKGSSYTQYDAKM